MFSCTWCEQAAVCSPDSYCQGLPQLNDPDRTGTEQRKRKLDVFTNNTPLTKSILSYLCVNLGKSKSSA